MKKQRDDKDTNSGSTSGGVSTKKHKNKKFECWYCGGKNHPIVLCPLQKAGKPPVKGTNVYNKRQKTAEGDKGE